MGEFSLNLSENLSGAHSESMPEQADTQAEQQRLQSLLLEISSALNNALPSCIDDELERCLQILIKALAVDRNGYFQGLLDLGKQVGFMLFAKVKVLN